MFSATLKRPLPLLTPAQTEHGTFHPRCHVLRSARLSGRRQPCQGRPGRQGGQFGNQAAPAGSLNCGILLALAPVHEISARPEQMAVAADVVPLCAKKTDRKAQNGFFRTHWEVAGGAVERLGRGADALKWLFGGISFS